MTCCLYSVAGSVYVSNARTVFEVKKDVAKESSSSSSSSQGTQAEGREVLSVIIYRELRGRSEIAIFLSPTPVRGMYMYIRMCIYVCTVCPVESLPNV